MLEASNITVSGGQSLSGFTQGDGSHLLGETIRLDTNDWLETDIRDGGQDGNFDDNDNNQRLDGAQAIDGTTYGNSTRVEAEYRLTLRDPGTGETWDVLGYNLDNSNPRYGTVEGLSFVGPPGGFPPVGQNLEVIAAYEGPGSFGQSSIDASDLASPPCFTPGTRILTPQGYRPVEHLKVGDLVETRDAGPQPLCWVGEVALSGEDLQRRPEFRPVRIKAHGFGPGRPRRDILLSPQHRILVTDWRAELFRGESEVLAASLHLVDGINVQRTLCPDGVRYLHIMCDSHQIVLAEGLEAETFLPGQTALAGVPSAAADEVLKLFPELALPGGAPRPARPILRGWEARVMRSSSIAA
jgi:hypothetical protein